MSTDFTFEKAKPSDFVVALVDDEGTKIGYPYKVVSIWPDENGGVGITVELPDGCGAGLNEGEYTPLHTRTEPKVKPLKWSYSASGRYQEVNSSSGLYEVGTDGDGWWAQCVGEQSWDWEESDQLSQEHEAKEAVQKEHERRIRSTLEG